MRRVPEEGDWGLPSTEINGDLLKRDMENWRRGGYLREVKRNSRGNSLTFNRKVQRGVFPEKKKTLKRKKTHESWGSPVEGIWEKTMGEWARSRGKKQKYRFARKREKKGRKHLQKRGGGFVRRGRKKAPRGDDKCYWRETLAGNPLQRGKELAQKKES